MPRLPSFRAHQQADGWVVSVPPTMSADGKRHRRKFRTRAEADRYAAKVRTTYASGRRGALIPAALALEAAEAQRLLEGTGIRLLDAAREAARRHAGGKGAQTFRKRWLAAMNEGEGHWSARYTDDMSRMVRWLPEWFLAMPVGEIDEDRIAEALSEVAPSTARMRARMISAVLTERRAKAPRRAAPEILTAAQAQALLDACDSPEERRAVALLLLAGVRPDPESGEISRLRWEDIGAQHVLIRPEASKTRTDRLIPITPRLRRELRGHPAEGSVTPAGWKRRWARIRKAAGITGHDITRHTFASHFLAWRGEDRTKEAMGHTADSRTLFRHYRRAVTPEAGRLFFNPKAPGGV